MVLDGDPVADRSDAGLAVARAVVLAAAAPGAAPHVHREQRQKHLFFLGSEAALGDGQAKGGKVKPKERHELVEEGNVAAVDESGAGSKRVVRNPAQEGVEGGPERLPRTGGCGNTGRRRAA